jgi:hyperosmotically inducible periplasmic protein
MKRKIAYLILAATLASVPLSFTTGCAVTQGRESAKEYAKDRELVARIKTGLYRDPVVKGTQIEVNALHGTVQLSGFADSEEARDRAERIATSTPGVEQVHNNILLPTGRTVR